MSGMAFESTGDKLSGIRVRPGPVGYDQNAVDSRLERTTVGDGETGSKQLQLL